MAKVKQAVSLFRRRVSLWERQTNSLPYIQSESAINSVKFGGAGNFSELPAMVVS
jgi:hypothetical protein